MRPFELDAKNKHSFFLNKINALTVYHRDNCALYSRYLDAKGYFELAESLEDIPVIPARFFKHFNLSSVTQNNIQSVAVSSGTGGNFSRIVLDAKTKLKQSRALVEILQSYVGPKKLPMLVVDRPSTNDTLESFNARVAGAVGFAQQASSVTYLLDEQMVINQSVYAEFMEKHGSSPFILFGFTFVIWESLVEYLKNNNKALPMDNAILFHGGGWKKVVYKGVSNQEFNVVLSELTRVKRIHNYYGMIEQTGSIFVECAYGKMHASKYSEVLVRDIYTRKVLKPGEVGVLQVLSLLPESYPGHSLLTEDIGWIEEDSLCPCQRNGVSVHITSRAQHAEVRGCSDAY